jgi:hypothetical protein
MMTQDRDYEDALRRALTAAAESIEPAGDGLQRIRHRLDSPRSPRSVLSGCAEWLELHGTRFLVRLEPVTDAGRTTLRRTGPLLALLRFLRGLLRPQAPRPADGHRGAAGSPGRLGPAGPWLKPVLAVSAAVAIVVGGVVILDHETGTLINPADGSYGSASPGSSLSSGGTTAKSRRWTLPLGIKTAPFTSPQRNPRVKIAAPVLPVVACTPTPSPTASTTPPTGGATATPTPTASGTATGTPATPQPTVTGQPTPTPTSSPATGSTATATTTADIVIQHHAGAPAIVECGASPNPSQTP